ncbi:MAG TPA: hypothetical protein VFQ61_35110, partial [Polyangiaceae bacterium]|nr:hypothetical protein [Polyangiaceae bacterium]
MAPRSSGRSSEWLRRVRRRLTGRKFAVFFSVIWAVGCERGDAPRDFKLELPETLLSTDPVRV